MTTPRRKLSQFICRRCTYLLAMTDGIDLYFGGRKAPGEPFQIQMLCPDCRADVRWKSTRTRKDVANVHKIG